MSNSGNFEELAKATYFEPPECTCDHNKSPLPPFQVPEIECLQDYNGDDRAVHLSIFYHRIPAIFSCPGPYLDFNYSCQFFRPVFFKDDLLNLADTQDGCEPGAVAVPMAIGVTLNLTRCCMLKELEQGLEPFLTRISTRVYDSFPTPPHELCGMCNLIHFMLKDCFRLEEAYARLRFSNSLVYFELFRELCSYIKPVLYTPSEGLRRFVCESKELLALPSGPGHDMITVFYNRLHAFCAFEKNLAFFFLQDTCEQRCSLPFDTFRFIMRNSLEVFRDYASVVNPESQFTRDHPFFLYESMHLCSRLDAMLDVYCSTIVTTLINCGAGATIVAAVLFMKALLLTNRAELFDRFANPGDLGVDRVDAGDVVEFLSRE